MNKLEEILEKHFSSFYDIDEETEVVTLDYKEAIKELSTLIQQEREEAVEECMNLKMKVGAMEREEEIIMGFVNTLIKNSSFYDLDRKISIGEIKKIKDLAKEYLNSIGSAKEDDTPEDVIFCPKCNAEIEFIPPRTPSSISSIGTGDSGRHRVAPDAEFESQPVRQDISSIKKEFYNLMPNMVLPIDCDEPNAVYIERGRVWNFFEPYLKKGKRK